MLSMEIHDEKNGKETTISIKQKSEFEKYTQKLFHVVSILRLNFLEPDYWSSTKMLNAVVTATMFGLACYSLIYTIHITFTLTHTSAMVMSSKLLLIAWAVQSVVSLGFLVHWQLNGHMKSFHWQLMECQNGSGVRQGKSLLMRNIMWFYVIIFLEVVIISLFNISYYIGNDQSDFAVKEAKMFYLPQLRIINSTVTLYKYLAWNVCMFVYIIYTNAAFLEVKYFNDGLEKLNGSSDDVENELLNKMEAYGRLCGIVRELDRIFRLYAFIMLAIIIPSVIFTLMMLNQRIHNFKDLVICLPSIALCLYSFLGVTVAPARLHDEVFTIAQALSSHMEQYDLGISIWGFAILSRPLVLATFSVMAMVLSVIIELTPVPHIVEVLNCTSSGDS